MGWKAGDPSLAGWWTSDPAASRRLASCIMLQDLLNSKRDEPTRGRSSHPGSQVQCRWPGGAGAPRMGHWGRGHNSTLIILLGHCWRRVPQRPQPGCSVSQPSLSEVTGRLHRGLRAIRPGAPLVVDLGTWDLGTGNQKKAGVWTILASGSKQTGHWTEIIGARDKILPGTLLQQCC